MDETTYEKGGNGMNDQSKIRVAVCANSLAVNGISAVIMNYVKYMDLNKFDITILAGAPVAELYQTDCRRLGVSIAILPERKTSSVSYYAALYRRLRCSHYDIFHIHGNSATITLELLIAAMCRVPVRIAHSHNTRCTCTAVHRLLSPVFPHIYTHAFACGTDAGRWLFGSRHFDVIPNGFLTEQFCFHEQLRNKTREKYQLKNRFVIGHIGRFNSQKNQPFLLEIFRSAAAMRDDICLMLAGDGPDYQDTMELIRSHPYKDRIIVCGETAHPEEFYAAMDIFALPSLYEGFPVVLLEAQINGLPCLVSDTVTREVRIGNRVRYISLQESAETWAGQLLRIPPLSAGERRSFYDDNVKMIGQYHIKSNVKLLETLYRSAIQETTGILPALHQEDLT